MGKRVLVTGATGYVGGIVRRQLAERWEVIGVSGRGDAAAGVLACDLTSLEQCRKLAQELRPEVVIHAAGYKDLRGCERDPWRAYAANVETVANVSGVFGGDCRVIHVGSDYVFSGEAGGYAEEAPILPRTVYGKTKAAGELVGWSLGGGFLVIRMAAIYDRHAPFLRFLLEQMGAGKPVDCYVDARYSPTYHLDFVALLEAVMTDGGEVPRLLHCCGDAVSRYEFALLAAESFGFDPALVRPSTRAGAAEGVFFSDLSLANPLTRARYGELRTPHLRALQELAEG